LRFREGKLNPFSCGSREPQHVLLNLNPFSCVPLSGATQTGALQWCGVLGGFGGVQGETLRQVEPSTRPPSRDRPDLQTDRPDRMLCNGYASDAPCTLHPSPCTLHPSPFILHPSPCTLHPTPYTLHPAPRTLHPSPCTLHPSPCALHPSPCTLHPRTHLLTPNPSHQPLTQGRRPSSRCLVTAKDIEHSPLTPQVPKPEALSKLIPV